MNTGVRAVAEFRAQIGQAPKVIAIQATNEIPPKVSSVRVRRVEAVWQHLPTADPETYALAAQSSAFLSAHISSHGMGEDRR